MSDEQLDALLALKRSSQEGSEHAATWGMPSFEGFHGENGPPATFPGLGFHTHPHLGVYSPENYMPFFPLIALSLPATLDRITAPGLDLPDEVLEQVKVASSTGELEFYFLVHSAHIKGPCQKFACERDDEINLMLHPFVFRDCKFDTNFSETRTVKVGLFAAEGVSEAHCDLKDGGVPFGRLEERTVAIHNHCFSPCNMHIRVSNISHAPFVFFVTVCIRNDSAAAMSIHCLPTSEEYADDVTRIMGKCSTLRDLLEEIALGEGAYSTLLSKLCTFFSA